MSCNHCSQAFGKAMKDASQDYIFHVVTVLAVLDRLSSYKLMVWMLSMIQVLAIRPGHGRNDAQSDGL